jgi:hypothetical protein
MPTGRQAPKGRGGNGKAQKAGKAPQSAQRLRHFPQHLAEVNEPAPPDPMLVAYIDEIHNAASVRDRAVYKAQQKFAWDLADAWKRWKKE